MLDRGDPSRRLIALGEVPCAREHFQPPVRVTARGAAGERRRDVVVILAVNEQDGAQDTIRAGVKQLWS